MDDGTGCIDVRQWINADEQQSESGLKEGCYARVVGNLKAAKGNFNCKFL
jgi:hypothetical protein